MDGWLHCISLAGAKGLVPATYVRMLAPGENPPTPQSPPQRGHSRQMSYDFFSQVGCIVSDFVSWSMWPAILPAQLPRAIHRATGMLQTCSKCLHVEGHCI